MALLWGLHSFTPHRSWKRFLLLLRRLLAHLVQDFPLPQTLPLKFSFCTNFPEMLTNIQKSSVLLFPLLGRLHPCFLTLPLATDSPTRSFISCYSTVPTARLAFFFFHSLRHQNPNFLIQLFRSIFHPFAIARNATNGSQRQHTRRARDRR